MGACARRALRGVCQKAANRVKDWPVIARIRQETGMMGPAEFKRWRKRLKLSQKDAAKALGLKRRVVQYYEKGERDGKTIEIPKTVRLACFAVAQGIEDYLGPPED
jgi:DNA-binding XRE family transcriptional regulator